MSLGRGAAAMTVATAVSRVTGFVRVMVVAGALGTTYLANTYQTANTAPNVLFELLAAGVLTSVFVPTFVEYLTREQREEGWDAANALTSVALAGLVALSIVVALAAPLIMKALTLGVEDPALRAQEVALGSTLLRLFSPQIALYGLGMIMTGALHAHRRFTLAAVAPIFNNVLVIGVYLTYALMRGDRSPSVETITTGETLVLGLGTTLGVVAMTFCLVPQLLRLGWRMRWSFRPDHPAVKRGARLGVWALGYAGGYQAGLIVVLLLANRVEGGVAAYQWAYTFFYMPHALFGVPIFNVLFPVMSEHAVRNEEEDFVDKTRDGLRMLAFILIPVAVVLAATAHPLTKVTLHYGVMTESGAALVARVLIAFLLGLPAYSAFLVFTRAFYARGDTKTPALVNFGTVALASIVGALAFLVLPDDWAVPGLAFGHSIAFVLGTFVIARVFAARVGTAGGTRSNASLLRSGIAGLAALCLMVVIEVVFASGTHLQALVEVVGLALCGTATYILVTWRMGSSELERVTTLLRMRR